MFTSSQDTASSPPAPRVMGAWGITMLSTITAAPPAGESTVYDVPALLLRLLAPEVQRPDPLARTSRQARRARNARLAERRLDEGRRGEALALVFGKLPPSPDQRAELEAQAAAARTRADRRARAEQVRQLEAENADLFAYLNVAPPGVRRMVRLLAWAMLGALERRHRAPGELIVEHRRAVVEVLRAPSVGACRFPLVRVGGAA